MNDKIFNVLIVGVGGQGILLASELLSSAAFKAGMDVKKSEVHGMAQRGGVVSSHVRFGKRVYSPLIPTGDAHVLLAFEQAEALRWSHHMRADGTAIVNRQRLVPPVALIKNLTYPTDSLDKVRNKVGRVIDVDAGALAASLGNQRSMNILLLGALSKQTEIPESVWKDVIYEGVPKGTEEVNWKAFKLGREQQ